MIHNNYLLLIAFHFHINFLNLLILLESFCFGELLFTSKLHDGLTRILSQIYFWPDMNSNILNNIIMHHIAHYITMHQISFLLYIRHNRPLVFQLQEFRLTNNKSRPFFPTGRDPELSCHSYSSSS